MTQPTSPSPTAPLTAGAARISFVEQYVRADKLLVAQLGPRDVEIPRRDKSGVILFPRFAVDLAQHICSKGIDPMHLKAAEVLDHARLYLESQADAARLEAASDGEESSTPPTSPVPAPAAPAPAPAAPAAAAAAAPAAAPAPAPAPAPKKRRASTTTPPATATAAPAAPASSVATPVAAPAALKEVAKTEETKGEPPILVGLAIYQLLHGADVLAERDMQPGADERRAQILALLAAYRPYTTV